MEQHRNINTRKNKWLFVFASLFISMCCFVNNGYSRIVESNVSGAIGEWEVSTTWTWTTAPTSFDPDDTVVVLAGHTVNVTEVNVNFPGKLVVVLGILDLNGGKLELTSAEASFVVIEWGAVITASDASNEKIKIDGKFVYDGGDGNIIGPAYLDNNGIQPNYPPGYNPLPVELLFFSARSSLDQVVLSWSTASELNNDFFTLEKSNNGTDFIRLGEVTGNGTTNLQKDYSFADPSPYLGLSYYRLSQTDYDGTMEIFPVVSVLFDGKKSFTIGPNPVSGSFLKLKISEMGEHELLELNIVDLQGRLVEQKQLRADIFGNVETDFHLDKPLQKGTYIFELVSQNSKEYLKVAAN